MEISESVQTSISAADGEGRSREICAKKLQVAQEAQLAFFLHSGAQLDHRLCGLTDSSEPDPNIKGKRSFVPKI